MPITSKTLARGKRHERQLTGTHSSHLRTAVNPLASPREVARAVVERRADGERVGPHRDLLIRLPGYTPGLSRVEIFQHRFNSFGTPERLEPPDGAEVWPVRMVGMEGQVRIEGARVVGQIRVDYWPNHAAEPDNRVSVTR